MMTTIAEELEFAEKSRADHIKRADDAAARVASLKLVIDKYPGATRIIGGRWGAVGVTPTHFDAEVLTLTHEYGVEYYYSGDRLRVVPGALYAEVDVDGTKARVYTLDRVDFLEAMRLFQEPCNKKTVVECLMETAPGANKAYLDHRRQVEERRMKEQLDKETKAKNA